MRFYSTRNRNLTVTLKEAVTQGLAPDQGLFMPDYVRPLSPAFFHDISARTFREMALVVARNLLDDDVPAAELERMIAHTITFDAPIVSIEADAYALELFHGPTLAFKDFGARFMSQLLAYFAREQQREITILVATSGDTGSAVANGFLGVPGTRVVVLYPEGKVSDIQEKQFTTLGENITAIAVDGTFDDCQRMVKEAFQDAALRERMFLTSANSINIARLIPQTFYYFHAWARLPDRHKPVVFSVPSGNFGNLTGGLLAQRMGLPVKAFVACTNVNDIVPEYLVTSSFRPRPSVATISNAMDVGNPSNFERMLDLFDNRHEPLAAHVTGYAFTDEETRVAMKAVYEKAGYVLDPHGAIGYLGLKKYQSANPDTTGIFLETAHPGKFRETVEAVLGETIDLPPALQRFLQREKLSISMQADYRALREFLASTPGARQAHPPAPEPGEGQPSSPSSGTKAK